MRPGDCTSIRADSEAKDKETRELEHLAHNDLILGISLPGNSKSILQQAMVPVLHFPPRFLGAFCDNGAARRFGALCRNRHTGEDALKHLSKLKSCQGLVNWLILTSHHPSPVLYSVREACLIAVKMSDTRRHNISSLLERVDLVHVKG